MRKRSSRPTNTEAGTDVGRRLSPRALVVALLVLVHLGASRPAAGEEHPLLLFGGPNRDRFLGCLNCGPDETFSVWNESGEYGSPAGSDCIWNRNGPYGSPASEFSPWSRDTTSPPFVVDRVGNFYGYFTRNAAFPDGVLEMRAGGRAVNPLHREVLEFLAWFLEDYDLILANLDEVRSNR